MARPPLGYAQSFPSKKKGRSRQKSTSTWPAGRAFLFAMCSAHRHLWTSPLARTRRRYLPTRFFDGDPSRPPTPQAPARLQPHRGPLRNFVPRKPNPLVYEILQTSTPPPDDIASDPARPRPSIFTLFEFLRQNTNPRARTMLTQLPTPNIVDGFPRPDPRAFRQSLIKDSVILLGQEEGNRQCQVTSHGRVGKGHLHLFTPGPRPQKEPQATTSHGPARTKPHPAPPIRLVYRLILKQTCSFRRRKKKRAQDLSFVFLHQTHSKRALGLSQFLKTSFRIF